jgi:VWFA-related protein
LAFRRVSRGVLAVLLGAGLASAGLTARAQTPPPSPSVPTFGAATELVYVRFHVERKGGKKVGYVEDLTPDKIRVLEDGKPQAIAVLETAATRDRTVLPEVTLVLDVSSSVMDERLLDETLIRQVLFGSLHAQSRVALCAFGGRLECFAEPTRDASALMDAFKQALRFGHETRRQGTRLYASVADVARQSASGGRAQRAMILFTDALDTEGGRVKDAVEAATAADVRVYAVKVSQAFQDTAQSRRSFGRGTPNRSMYDYRKLELDALPEATGGRSFEPGTLDEKSLAKILREIGAEISNEIVVGYEPEGARTGMKHKVKVELVDKSSGKIRDGERILVR